MTFDVLLLMLVYVNLPGSRVDYFPSSLRAFKNLLHLTFLYSLHFFALRAKGSINEYLRYQSVPSKSGSPLQSHHKENKVSNGVHVRAIVQICCGVAGPSGFGSECIVVCHNRHVIVFGECVIVF